jgi:hypothetical protein
MDMNFSNNVIEQLNAKYNDLNREILITRNNKHPVIVWISFLSDFRPQTYSQK